MNKNKNINMLEKIQSNIETFGHHIHLVFGGPSPRFAYTIGVSQELRVEIIFAGASYYSTEDVNQIVNFIVAKIKTEKSWHKLNFEINSLGSFSVHAVDASWSKMMMLGAYDFYKTENIQSLQIVPDKKHWTIDIPDLTKPWSCFSQPLWKWLGESWKFSVPDHSTTITNLAALKGELITEAMRWEEDQWELFAGAGPDVKKEDIREVSLGTLLAIDSSLTPITELDIGQGLWRDPDELKWNTWEIGSNQPSNE